MKYYLWLIALSITSCIFNSCAKDGFEDLQIEGIDCKYSGLRILWLGTSIPHGCTYPAFSCWKLGLKCNNKSSDNSQLCFSDQAEKPLTATTAELKQLLKEGVLTNRQYWKAVNNCYESLLLPNLAYTDVVVLDHGYNDISELMIVSDTIDWESTDRTNFIGAFNYLYNIIKATNPNTKVIVGGYFQNTCTIGYAVRGKYVADVITKIAEHYDLPLLDVWNYVDLPDGYASGSENYLDSLNSRYGSSFTKWRPNDKGEITYFQKFCPDAVHPFSDPTGESDRILNVAVTKQLYQALSEAYRSDN